MTALLLRRLHYSCLAGGIRNRFLFVIAPKLVIPIAAYSASSTRIKRSWPVSKLSFRRLCSTRLSAHEFGEVCEETLDSLADYFEELVESLPALKNGDISYSDGVITAYLSSELGTYVINRQTPNQQIWLSSPTSGPKRYDFVDNAWLYKHDSTTLHSLLDKELAAALNCPVEFSSRCVFGRKAQ